MFNKGNKQSNMQHENTSDSETCNNSHDPALLEYMADKMNAITSNKNNDASNNFKNQLKQQILEKRHNTGFMNTIKTTMNELLSSRYVKVGAIVVLVLAIVSTSSYFFQLGKQPNSYLAGVPQKISEIIIPSAQAYDNFTLTPMESDSFGVEGNSGYILKSKEQINDDLIKEYITITGIGEYELKTISRTEWHIFPKTEIEPNTLVTVAVPTLFEDHDGNIHERNFSWTYQIKDSLKVLSSIPSNGAVSVPVNTGIELKFSYDTVDVEKFNEYFSIEPSVEGHFEKHDRTIVFVPEESLNKKAVYTVTVQKDVAVHNSNEQLAQDYILQFETEGFDTTSGRTFDIYNHNYEFDDQTVPYVQIYQYFEQKSEALQVSIYKFKSTEAFIDQYINKNDYPTWSNGYRNYSIDTTRLDQVSNFVAPIVEQDNNKLIVFPESLANGFYVAEVADTVAKEQVIIQVSSLAPYITLTETDSLIWVNDTKTKNVVSEAEVSFLNVEKDPIYTDEKGVARFETLQEILDEQSRNEYHNQLNNYYVKISHNNNEIVAPLHVVRENLYYDYSWTDPSSDYWSYIYTDKPIYNPDDTIKLWGFVKPREDNTAVANVEVTLENYYFWDYFGNKVPLAQQTISLDGNSFSSELPINNIKPGYYQLFVKVDGEEAYTKSITIEEYVKPAYQITVESNQPDYYVGDTATISGEVTFFDGTPVPHLELGFDVYGNKQVITTDESGEYAHTFTVEQMYSCEKYSCYPEYQSIDIRPEREELADINAYVSFEVYGASRKMKAEVDYNEAGKAALELTSYFVTTDETGNFITEKIAPQTEFSTTITRVTYGKVEVGDYYDYINKKVVKKYEYQRNEDIVNSFSSTTDNDGVYKFVQDIEPETSYEIKIVYKDSEGREDKLFQYLYYYDGITTYNYDSFGQTYYHLDFDEEKRYRVGEEVVISYKKGEARLPQGENNFLFYQAQQGLQEYRVQDTSEYRFEFNRDDIPNVQPRGVYFDGTTYHDTGSSWLSNGVKYNFDEEEIKISLSVDKESYQPGGEAKINITVTDLDDNPIKADVNINLVDEAVYALVAESVNPLSELYRNVPHGIISSYISHEKSMNLFGGAEGGGCFGAGTQITLADGSTINIEDIQVGDEIRTYTDPLRQNITTGKVTDVFKHIVSNYLIINGEMVVTPEHIVYSNGQFKQAGEMRKGDWMLQDNGDKYIIHDIEQRFDTIPVYNFRVDPQHTYFANGLYVHNDKGGGIRDNFMDVAAFKTITTNARGTAETTLTLPDNITSWRVTAQAITDDLQAGSQTENIIVTKPAFVQVTVGDTYLEGESPLVRLQSFGSKLNTNEPVTYTLIEDENMFSSQKTEPQTIKSTAFEPVYMSFSDTLKHGNYNPVYKMNSDAGEDAVSLPMSVIGSRLTQNDTTKIKATNNFSIRDDSSYVDMAILDEKSSLIYYPLMDMAWSYGDRVDQSFARYYGRKIANEKLGFDIHEEEFDPFVYQREDGGISLLPYSSSDIDWSTRLAFIGQEDIDTSALSSYFLGIVESEDSNQEEISYALAGLAALRQPIIPKMTSWLQNDALTVRERLVLAYGLQKLGASQWAYDLYTQVIDEHAHKKGNSGYIDISDDTPDKIYENTFYAAVVGAGFQDSYHKTFWNYVLENQTLYGDFADSENLFNLEKIGFISTLLQQPYTGEITFDYLGTEYQRDLFKDGPVTLRVSQNQKDSFKVKSVTGDVLIWQTVQKPIDVTTFQTVDNDLQITKEYYVNGEKTNTFNVNDIVEVRLETKFAKGALEDTYQITDTIPSGLKPLNVWNGYYNSCTWNLYDIEDDQMKFTFSRNSLENYCDNGIASYYLKVETKGSFKSEPALIQSFNNSDLINYSNSQEIVIQ